MEEGSWSDAETYCRHGYAHLWSINSHFEWWNIYNYLTSRTESLNSMIELFRNLPTTVLLFIGLHVQHNKVMCNIVITPICILKKYNITHKISRRYNMLYRHVPIEA